MVASMTAPQVLTVPEVAAILRVNPQTVYRALEAGRMRGVKVGSAWRVPQAALEAFLRGDRPQTDTTGAQ